MAMMLVNGKKTNVIQMNPKGKKTIIMIHGLFTGLAVYYFSIAPRLAKKYHVVLYDLRGHGLSELCEEMLTPKNLSEDLVALMSTLKIEKAYLVGYSFGGSVALYTSIYYPHLVERLAVIDMSYLSENELGFISGVDFDADVDIDVDADVDADVDMDVDFEIEIKKHIQAINGKVPNQVSEKAMKRLKNMFGDGKLATMLQASRQILEELPIIELKTPVLLLYGRKSPYLQTGKKLQKEITNARLRIGRGDHNIPLQSPLWLVWYIRKFLAQS
jgi:pimeloyl-ACP methyl ester carboxylesterase